MNKIRFTVGFFKITLDTEKTTFLFDYQEQSLVIINYLQRDNTQTITYGEY